ncbi:hypothetical protein ACIRP7_37040 [Streptomyces sp. NPDC102270]|uniref:hypothetical protein n=1 Tax=Streptomyces sp. NPDC102270 TaxID=3366150 RepID=UPI0038297B43
MTAMVAATVVTTASAVSSCPTVSGGTSAGSDQIAACLEDLEHEYGTAVDDDGELKFLPVVSERARAKLNQMAARKTRPPKQTARPLAQRRAWWKASAILTSGVAVDVINSLLEYARAAAAAIRARVAAVVDVALAAVDVVAVVYVMRGAFKRHHLPAEARRYLSCVLRGRPHQPGLDEQIVQTVVDDYTRPASRRMMTADLRALYPRDTEEQAVLRPLTRKRTAPPYGRARLTAGALTARVHAARRADRLGSRTRPYAVSVAAASRSHPRPFHSGRKDGRLLEPETRVDTVEQTRRTFEAAAKLAAKLQDGKRERAVAHGSRPQPAPATASPPHTQQLGTQHTPGRTTEGVA